MHCLLKRYHLYPDKFNKSNLNSERHSKHDALFAVPVNPDTRVMKSNNFLVLARILTSMMMLVPSRQETEADVGRKN